SLPPVAVVAPSIALPANAVVRPAITGDPMSLAQGELTKLGYPMRPDPVQAPDAYNTWLKLVSQPAAFIPPRLITRAEHGRDVASSNIVGATRNDVWSGFEMSPGKQRYDFIFGT